MQEKIGQKILVGVIALSILISVSALVTSVIVYRKVAMIFPAMPQNIDTNAPAVPSGPQNTYAIAAPDSAKAFIGLPTSLDLKDSNGGKVITLKGTWSQDGSPTSGYAQNDGVSAQDLQNALPQVTILINQDTKIVSLDKGDPIPQIANNPKFIPLADFKLDSQDRKVYVLFADPVDPKAKVIPVARTLIVLGSDYGTVAK